MLEPIDLDLLLAAAAPRIDVDLSRLFTVAWVDFSVRQPTAGFLAELVSPSPEAVHDTLARLGGAGALTRFRLLTTAPNPSWQPSTPRVHALVEVPQRIVDFVTGTGLHRRGHAGCNLVVDPLPTDELVVESEVIDELRSQMRKPRPRVCLLGPEKSGRRTLACAVSRELGLDVLEVDLAQALDGTVLRTLVDQLADIVREARLHRAALLLRLDTIAERTALDEAIDARAPALRNLLAEVPGPLFASAAQRGPRVDRLLGHAAELTVPSPDTEQQRVLWDRALDGHIGDRQREAIADDLARSYRLVPGVIVRAVEQAVEQATPTGRRSKRELSSMDLVQTIRRRFDHGLGWLADVVTVRMGLDEIVLDDTMREQIEEVMRFARQSHRVFETWGFSRRGSTGRGLSMLFSGPPGTGKTLTAGVIARELGRVLYRIDLSRIVDKYIGETEKNLARVFDEAERAQAVILFDEADSLFAQRTSVKSSNDRYANLEVNFLLQRLDDYTGVSILTTNFAASIDEAFQRRIRFIIDFPMPSAELRAELWQKLLPPGAPLSEDEIDWEDLGDLFEFSGGHIRNAVLRAAIEAAEFDRAIDHELLFRAAQAEAREMGQLVTSEEPEGVTLDDFY